LELEGQVALVTGGAVRIGRAIAAALAEAKAAVVVPYHRSADEARSLVKQIEGSGGQAAAVQGDLADPLRAAEAIFEAAIERFGRVDLLVNNASIFEPGTLLSTSQDQWRRHFAVNLEAPFALCRELARRRLPARPAAIVNIVDWRGLRPPAGHLAYTLTKAALVALTRLLAQELAPEVRVNAVAPGAILPPAGAGEDFLRRLAERVPLERHGEPADVAAAVIYLLRSDFVTGEILCVTGGEEL
jgi:NAD(P)-dependent dehydrogenase (short-subunit alcohol dehydrogenase family)